MTEGDAGRDLIRDKLRTGRLPREACVQTWHGHGQGATCAGCDQVVLAAERECEVDFADGRTFRFHRDCFYTWDEERRLDDEEPIPLEDVSAITAAILVDALCVPCVAVKTGLAPSRVRAFLTRIRETVSLTQARGTCAECARPSTTYQIG
jgi:hypothetical protein